MAIGTIDYLHSPNDVVWHITDDCGVKEATVLQVTGVVETTGTVITYRIKYIDDSVTVDATDKLYTLIADAMVAYEAELTA